MSKQAMSGRPTLLSLGMGVESTAVLLRWLLEPETRPCPLDQLVVVTAMTGEEYERTEELMNEHVLPVMRQLNVRYVQLCRAGQSDSDGYVVLDDSRQPQCMHMKGPWRLGDEYEAAGTVPQQAGPRKCSQRAKGWVIDAWVADEFGGGDFRHAIGFNSEELNRVERDQCYGAVGRQAFYPLVEWGWSRDDAELFLLQTTGETWSRSCCVWCPYQAGRKGIEALVERWRRQPEAGARAIWMEHTAVALNPRQQLFGTVSAAKLAQTHALTESVLLAEDRLNAGPWCIYEVRRVFLPAKGDPEVKGPAWRAVRRVSDTMPRASAYPELKMTAGLKGLQREVDDHGIHRVVFRAAGKTYPAVEEQLVAAPAIVLDKQRAGFESLWNRVLGIGPVQDALFDALELIGNWRNKQDRGLL
jgi:hypothetical protein